jgi:hypothetical protein
VESSKVENFDVKEYGGGPKLRGITRGGGLRTKRDTGRGGEGGLRGEDGTQWRQKVPVTFLFFPFVSAIDIGPSASIRVRTETCVFKNELMMNLITKKEEEKPQQFQF